MRNQEQELYDPKTAFGNKKLISVVRKNEKLAEQKANTVSAICYDKIKNIYTWTCPKDRSVHQVKGDDEGYQGWQNCTHCYRDFYIVAKR